MDFPIWCKHVAVRGECAEFWLWLSPRSFTWQRWARSYGKFGGRLRFCSWPGRWWPLKRKHVFFSCASQAQHSGCCAALHCDMHFRSREIGACLSLRLFSLAFWRLPPSDKPRQRRFGVGFRRRMPRAAQPNFVAMGCSQRQHLSGLAYADFANDSTTWQGAQNL